MSTRTRRSRRWGGGRGRLRQAFARWSRRTRFSIASLTLIATIALQIAVLYVFLNEPTQPPIRGAFSEALWVKARPELMYAFLALLVLGPVCLMLFAAAARHYLSRVVYVGLWIVFATTLTVMASQKFTAVAEVAWDYVIKERLPEAQAAPSPTGP